MPDPAEKQLDQAQQEALEEARAAAARETEREAKPAGVVVKHPTSTRQPAARLEVDPAQTWWTDAQRAALSAIGLEEVPDGDLVAFLHVAQRSGLDPFAREVYLIGRKDRDAPSGTRYTIQTGIDGYRHIAERTGEKVGELGPFWAGADGEWRDVWLADEPPKAARFGIIRRGQSEPVWGTAIFREFAPMYDKWEGPKGNRRRVVGQDGKPVEELGAMWAKMPAHMIAKCAEALAIRRAFPRQAAGIYLEEEMHQADAAVERKAHEEAEALRDQQRRELATRPWEKEPAKARPEELGVDVVDGDVVAAGEPEPVLDREALEHELAEQARVLDTTVAALVRRWVAAHRKNIEQASDRELYDLIVSRREEVRQALIAKMGTMPADVEDATVEDAQDTAPAPAQEPPAASKGRRTRKADSVPQEPAQPEPCSGYRPWGDADDAPCLTCGQPKHD